MRIIVYYEEIYTNQSLSFLWKSNMNPISREVVNRDVLLKEKNKNNFSQTKKFSGTRVDFVTIAKLRH